MSCPRWINNGNGRPPVDAQYTSLWASKIAPRCAIGNGGGSSGGQTGPEGPPGPPGAAGPSGAVGPTGPAGGGALSVELKELFASQTGPTGNTGTALSTSINTTLLSTPVTPLLNFNAVSEIGTEGSANNAEYFNGVTSICNVPGTDDYIFATDIYNSVTAPYSLTIGNSDGPNRGLMYARVDKTGNVAWRSGNVPVGLGTDFSSDLFSQIACDTNFLVTLDTFKSTGFYSIYGGGKEPTDPGMQPQTIVSGITTGQYNVTLIRRPINGDLQPSTNESNPLQTNWWVAKFIPTIAGGTDVYGNGVSLIENNVCALITFGDGDVDAYDRQNIPGDETKTTISGLGTNKLACVVYYSTTGQYLRHASIENVDYDTTASNSYTAPKFYNRITSDEKNVYVMVNALGSSSDQNINFKNSGGSTYVTINTGDTARKIMIAGLSEFGFYQWYYYVRETSVPPLIPLNINGQSIVVKDDVVYVTFEYQGVVEIRTRNTQWATLPTSSGTSSIGLIRISAKTGQFIDAKELVSCPTEYVNLTSTFSSITPIDGNRKYYMTCSINTSTPSSDPIMFTGLDGNFIELTPPFTGPTTFTIMYDSTGTIAGLNYTGGPNTPNTCVALSNCIGVSSNNTVVVGGAYTNEVFNDPSAYISTFGTTNESLTSSAQTLSTTGNIKKPLFTVYLIPTCLGTLGTPGSSNTTKTLIATNTNGNVFEVVTNDTIVKGNTGTNTVLLPKTGSTANLFWDSPTSSWYVLSSVDAQFSS